MFERLADISNTGFDDRVYTSDDSLPLPTNKVGIEIEMEGIKSFGDIKNVLRRTGYWDVVEDHSLRGNSCELVSVPIFGKDIEEALGAVEMYFKRERYKPTFNVRTSLHIHVEVVDMSRGELTRFIILYCALERFLFNYCDDTRVSNRYAVPIYDNEGLQKHIAHLLSHIEQGNRHRSMAALASWPKYCALNLNNITGIGTAEFRHMHGSIDKEEILTWIKLVLCVKKFALGMGSINDFPELVSGFNPIDYLHSIFGDLTSKILNNKSAPDLLKGVRIAQDILMHKRLVKATDIIYRKNRGKDSSLNKIHEVHSIAGNLPELAAKFAIPSEWATLPGTAVPGITYSIDDMEQ